MNTKILQRVCLGLVLVVSLPVVLRADEKHEETEKQAIAAARSWLAGVDDGKYANGWESASDLLKTALTKADFEKALAAARTPLGAAKERQVKSHEYQTSLSGAPDGEYVVIQFQTSFINKKAAIETITSMLRKDHAWHVSGYYIK